jgi:deoxyribose-phosphate aldolase
MDYSYDEIAKLIDHALLNPALTVEELERGCGVALEYDVASVCILPYYLKRCAEILKGTTIQPSTTIGFPHGAQTTATKLVEAEQAIAEGCEELDMVVNISQVLSGHWNYVRAEVKTIVDLAHEAGRKVKVIFENCYLTHQHKIQLCQLCGELEADWVKTSTGFGSGGATFDDVQLMVEHSPRRVQVKASGGIRDLDTVLRYRALGATRVGLSRTQEILDECRRRLGEV